MIWTTEDYFRNGGIRNDYLLALDKSFKTGFKLLADEKPEEAINDWISNVTNNKINKLYGREFIHYIFV